MANWSRGSINYTKTWHQPSPQWPNTAVNWDRDRLVLSMWRLNIFKMLVQSMSTLRCIFFYPTERLTDGQDLCKPFFTATEKNRHRPPVHFTFHKKFRCTPEPKSHQCWVAARSEQGPDSTGPEAQYDGTGSCFPLKLYLLNYSNTSLFDFYLSVKPLRLFQGK